jgi:predicted lipid-binding transport protein (Tim44 family)
VCFLHRVFFVNTPSLLVTLFNPYLFLMEIFAMTTPRLIQLAVAAFAALTLIASPVEAKRLGGGSGSKVGKPTNNAAMQKPAAPAAAPAAAAPAAAAPAAAAAKPANKWLGPLAGVAAGLGIAALMSSMGMGGAMASMLSNVLLFGGLLFLGFFLYRKFFAAKQPALQGAGALGAAGASANPNLTNNPYASSFQAQQPAAQGQIPAPQASAFQAPAAPVGGASVNHPSVTDVTGFTTNAKTQYLALQAAWDAGDLGKLRNMTTDTLFMELAQQVANRKGAPNHTEVMNLHCELLDVRDEASETVATLRFTGTAREDGAATAGFEDIWTLTKPSAAASGWLLAGVESN